jgi:uncharacterized protein YneF (UPF0154 family)
MNLALVTLLIVVGVFVAIATGIFLANRVSESTDMTKKPPLERE